MSDESEGTWRHSMRITLSASLILLASMLGCSKEESTSTNLSSTSGQVVSKSEIGESWPFTVEFGTVDCAKNYAAIFIVDGKTYQLNGFASSRGFNSIDPIWKDDPAIPGAKINLQPMIDLALKQCSLAP